MSKIAENMIGQKVIVRGRNSGVFFGVLEEKDGTEVKLTNCRRIWYWDGANTLSQVAVDGVSKPSNCKFTVSVEEIIITDVIEIIPCTKTASESIEGVWVWKV